MPIVSKQKPTVVSSNIGKTPVKRPAIKSNAVTNVIDRIAPINFDDDDGMKINLYGRSGTGKTTVWSTFPKPILVAVVSGGTKPGELRSIDTPENRKTIKQVTLLESREIFDIAAHAAETGIYKTVVLDHASGLQDLVLKEVLGLEEIPISKTWGTATRDQYGQVIIQCKELLRSLLNLSCNVVIVAQERDFDPERGESEIMLPSVSSGMMPKLAEWFNPTMDYICQTFIRQKEREVRTVTGVGKQAKTTVKKVKTDEVEFCLRTGPHPIFTTKFRMPKGGVKLPEFISDPTYEKINALIKGKGVSAG